jgi:phosphopantetheinyl transferase
MSRVIVLHAELPGGACADSARALPQRLAYARRLDLERRDPQSRAASLAALELALAGLSRLTGREVDAGELHFPQDGKPRWQGAGFFSVSHTLRRVAVALSEHCEVGIDVEDLPAQLTTASPTYSKLERWTAIEAVLKAAGHGLRRLKDVALEPAAAQARFDGRIFFLRPVALGPGIVAHLATAAPVEQLELG